MTSDSYCWYLQNACNDSCGNTSLIRRNSNTTRNSKNSNRFSRCDIAGELKRLDLLWGQKRS